MIESLLIDIKPEFKQNTYNVLSVKMPKILDNMTPFLSEVLYKSVPLPGDMTLIKLLLWTGSALFAQVYYPNILDK